MENTAETKYNRAKPWQLLFFVFNNTASSTYLCIMMFVNLYAGNVAGLAVLFVSNVMMAARFWDGITDPIIGFVVDRTNGKFGKFRPFMLLGNLIMLGTVTLMFTTTHLVPEGIRGVYWTLIYLVYIIGYTFQNAATRGGQSVLTNDPKQRPIFARVDGIINFALSMGITLLITDILYKKHGGFSDSLFIEMICILGPVSLVLTILAIIGIAEKDKPENYEALGKQARYGFKDIFKIIKRNRAIQMLVLAASTDKLANQIKSNSVVGIMLYGIIIGNYTMLSRMSMLNMIPSMILIVVGTGVAARFSLKKATVIFTWISILCTTLMGALLVFGDPTQISLEHISFMTIGYLALSILTSGCAGVTTSLATPMIADCADYELYQSGSYAPALMGTVFGFFDKVVSSFAATVVGWCMVAIGFADRFPVAEDPLTPSIFWITMFLLCGIPILGWICSLVAMKFYPLDAEKMLEVQSKIAEIKAQGAVEQS